MIGLIALKRGLFGALCVMLSASVTLAASTQNQQAENIAAARALGIQGVQLADAGKCPEAIEKLSRAEALYHAPTILGRLGECQVEVGQIVLGTENLNRVVREQLPSNAPVAFRNAQERAAKVLERALPRIARLTVVIEPRDAQASVTVGGAPVPAALIGAERPTDPGRHEVVATAPGYLEARAQVELAEGGRETVTLQLSPDPNAAAAAPAAEPEPAPAAPPPAAPPAAERSGGNKTLSFVLLGVGGVGLAVGGVTGVMALGAKNDLDCPNNRCSGENADKLDSANTLATVSTVSFAVGAAAGIVGIVLLATSPSSQPPAAAKLGPITAQPFVGRRTLGLAGTF